MEKTRGYYRYQRIKHIKRKERLLKELYNGQWKVCSGSLNKGKIHCSCSLCREKSYEDYAATDKRKKASLMSSLEDFWS